MSDRRNPILVASLALAGALTAAPAAAADAALASTHRDAELKWGPCPEFLPKGCEIAVLHGDPAQPNVDIFFKVPGGSAIAEHWHTSAERMVLVSGTMSVTYTGQDPVVLHAGSYAYGPPRAPHHAWCEKGDPCVLFIAFEAPLDAFPIQAAN